MALLILYKKDSCPYCRIVIDFIEQNNVEIEMKELSQDRQAQEDLLRIGGKTQVPCLSIEGEAMYESQNIIQWLKKNVC